WAGFGGSGIPFEVWSVGVPSRLSPSLRRFSLLRGIFSRGLRERIPVRSPRLLRWLGASLPQPHTQAAKQIQIWRGEDGDKSCERMLWVWWKHRIHCSVQELGVNSLLEHRIGDRAFPPGRECTEERQGR